MSNYQQAPPPAMIAENPISAVDIRRSALLATEGTGALSVSDINRVLENRLIHGGYGKDLDSMAVRPNQFAGIQDRGTRGFLNIRTWEDAARYTGTDIGTLKSYHKAINNPEMQRQSLEHVGGALEFRASEENYKKLSNTSQRLRGQPGGSLHNQFLTGSKDPHIKLPSRMAGEREQPLRFKMERSKIKYQKNPLSISPHSDENVGSWIFQ